MGASPECDLLRPHYDTGLRWPDPANPKPDDPLWGAGVRAGIRWDGTFYRDLARYPAGGWCAYFPPGQNRYWINFGAGWCHLANDDPARLLTGAAPRIFFEAGSWHLIIEATKFVTGEVVNVWTGEKAGDDPAGEYTRVSGLDPLESLTMEGA